MGVVPMIALVLIGAGIVLLILAFVSHRRRWQQRSSRYLAPVRPALPVAPKRRPVRADVPHLLYVYMWKRGGEAYFGISNEPPKRHARHERDPKDQWWMQETTGVMFEVQWYPNRATARAAERAAVQAASARGAWLANDHHNPRGRARVS